MNKIRKQNTYVSIGETGKEQSGPEEGAGREREREKLNTSLA